MAWHQAWGAGRSWDTQESPASAPAPGVSFTHHRRRHLGSTCRRDDVSGSGASLVTDFDSSRWAISSTLSYRRGQRKGKGDLTPARQACPGGHVAEEGKREAVVTIRAILAPGRDGAFPTPAALWVIEYVKHACSLSAIFTIGRKTRCQGYRDLDRGRRVGAFTAAELQNNLQLCIYLLD